MLPITVTMVDDLLPGKTSYAKIIYSTYAVSGTVYIMLYDAADQLIGVRPLSIYLKGSAIETETVKLDTKYSYPTYDHYKLAIRAYSKAY